MPTNVMVDVQKIKAEAQAALLAGNVTPTDIMRVLLPMVDVLGMVAVLHAECDAREGWARWAKRLEAGLYLVLVFLFCGLVYLIASHGGFKMP